MSLPYFLFIYIITHQSFKNNTTVPFSGHFSENFHFCLPPTSSLDLIQYIERDPRKKKFIFLMEYTAQPTKMCYAYINDGNSTPEKDKNRHLSGKRSDLIAAVCLVSIFPARHCCRRNKEKERKYTNGK